MPTDLFDRRLRVLRRDRAARVGPELFLYDRAFEDCLDRLRDIVRRFDHCLLIGCPSSDWPESLKEFADKIDPVDPGRLFAAAVGGQMVEEDRFDFGLGQYDLVVAIGTLDSVNDLPLALKRIHRALRPGSPLIGAIAGGNSFPALRTSLIEASRAEGRAVARVHPRIEAPTFAALLSAAGYSMPVVDVDRVGVRYSGLGSLVKDLRAMGATSMLSDRSPPLTRREFQTACRTFDELATNGRTAEQIEIIHFLGWRQ